MVDTPALEVGTRKGVWVRVPPSVQNYKFLVSSAVLERSPVKRRVSGSNPLRGANVLIYRLTKKVNQMKDKILELRKLGFSYNEISKRLNCSKSTISYHCSKIENNVEKIKVNTNIKNKKQEKKEKSFLLETEKADLVIELRKQNKSYDEIIELTKLSYVVISKICRVYKLSNNKKYENKNEENIKEVVNLYEKFGSIRKVSNLLGISRHIVSKYINIENKPKIERKKQLVNGVIEWRKRVKLKLVEYKGGVCEKCNYNKCINALEFHHLDPSEKDFTISGKSWSFEKLKKEADKCILVCNRCHTEIHYLE
jgi:DNA invertase Pin-like site-specific DNA recombinase